MLHWPHLSTGRTSPAVATRQACGASAFVLRAVCEARRLPGAWLVSATAARSAGPRGIDREAQTAAAGAMFWLTRNRFAGSYFALAAASRS